MKYVCLNKSHEYFGVIGDLCIQQVVEENLHKNGGMLFVRNAIFYSDFILVAMNEEQTLMYGFIALKSMVNHETKEAKLYINQIAVKKAYQRQGIAKTLLQKVILESDMDIICHIKAINLNSQSFFESMGFIKDENSNVYNPTYHRTYQKPELKGTLT